MEKSYDENLARLMSEARDLLKSYNYLDSAKKYLEAAQNQEKTRGIEQARDLYFEAIKNFIRASEDYKEKKQFRKSAESLYYVSQIYKHLGQKEDWAASTKALAEDLINAAKEYILWNEYDQGIVLAATACFFLFSIEDFDRAQKYYTEYISKIQNDPAFTFAQQVMYAAGYAIKAIQELDTEALMTTQQLVGSHLKPGLSRIMGDLFFPAIDDAVSTVMQHFRSKIKLPKMIPTLTMTKDLVFNTPAELKIILENEGEGEAYNIELYIELPEKLEVLDGSTHQTIERLDAGKTTEIKLVLRCIDEECIKSPVEISAKMSFYDKLQTKQTMMIGPYEFIFREKSLKKELSEKVSYLKEQLIFYKDKLSKCDVYPTIFIEKNITHFDTLLNQIEKLVLEEDFDTAQANIRIIESIFSLLEELSSEEFVEAMKLEKEKEIQENIQNATEQLKAELTNEFEAKLKQQEQDFDARLKKMKEDFEREKELLQQKFEEETKKALEEQRRTLLKQKEQELQELTNELSRRYKEELKEEIEQLKKEKEQEINTLKQRFEQEKRKALEEQENILRAEFQKQIDSLQNKGSS